MPQPCNLATWMTVCSTVVDSVQDDTGRPAEHRLGGRLEVAADVARRIDIERTLVPQ